MIAGAAMALSSKRGYQQPSSKVEKLKNYLFLNIVIMIKSENKDG
jgi:hypothetical protein